jgi:hypothetical protein
MCIFGVFDKDKRLLCIFTEKRLTYIEVAPIARDDIMQRERAFTAYAPAIPADLD